MNGLSYPIEASMDPHEVTDVYRRSGITQPIDDLPRLTHMLQHAYLMISACDQDHLVGFVRPLTELLNISLPWQIQTQEETSNISWRECSKKFVQQGRSHFDAGSVYGVREHGKMARTSLAAFFNIPLTEFSYDCYVTDLAVIRGYQRRGIGTKFLHTMQKKLSDEVMVCVPFHLLKPCPTILMSDFKRLNKPGGFPVIVEGPLPDTKRANSSLPFLPFPAVYPGEIQTRDSNRKQLNSMEDGTTLRSL